MPTRNINVEKQMVDTFIKTKGRKPESSQDWADVMRMAYPTNELPDEIKNSEAASLYSAGFSKPVAPPAPTLTPPAAAPTPGTPAFQGQAGDPYSQSLAGQANEAKTASDTAFNAYDSMPSGNEALRVLQEAIKAKASPRDFAQAPIGESEIFKQAGVGGFGALAQSLNTRGQELEMNRADFANTISQMADVYKTNAESVQRRYEKSVDNYKFITDMLNKEMDQIRDNEHQMQILKLQNSLSKDLENLRSRNDITERGVPTINDQISAADKGLEITNGRVTDPSKGIVAGFNIGRYATDPNHERAVASIVQGMGQLKNLNEVTNYIKTKYPNSPITADMVSKASEKFGVPWEMLLAMMEQDSSLGTEGKGARTFNPGNVGNDDSGNIRNYGDWQSGVDAVAKWLSKNRVSPTAGNSDAAKTAQDIFNGTSNLKVSDLPTNQRESVNRELIKLKDEAVKSGNTEGLIRASAGGSAPSDSFKQSFEKGLNVIAQIGDLQANIQKTATGPILGAIRKKNPYDKKAQEIQAQLAALVPNLARGVYGEVGVLTDQDIAQYTKTLPNLTSPDDVNRLILGATIRSVQRSLENKLKVQAGSGTDVSGLADVYTQVKQQADSLLAPYSQSQGSTGSGGIDLSKFERP